MSNVRRKLKGKKPPEGWELIEEVIEDFETQMKDAVNEGDEGKRKAELSWKIHRLHWEKNRFIYDLMYVRKVMNKELVSNEHYSGWRGGDCRVLHVQVSRPAYPILCAWLDGRMHADSHCDDSQLYRTVHPIPHTGYIIIISSSFGGALAPCFMQGHRDLNFCLTASSVAALPLPQ